MSYFDDASLVMIPSGYKTSKVYSVKPTDGSGDLTFSRSNDTATRVNSAGLIEKVRTNVITYSNTFSNAAWVKQQVGTGTTPVVTANYTTDPFGGNNAWRLQCNLNGGTTSGDRSWIYNSFGALSQSTISIYVKLNTAGTKDVVFSDSGGSVTTLTSTDWVRISITATGAGGEFRFGLIGGSTSDTLDCSIAFAQAESGDIATDYIATTSAAVSVGPVANVPRLDYLNSSCPRLLLEPQRTNALTYSEDFSNAAYTKGQSSITVNAAIAPDGTMSADKLVEDTSNNTHVIYRSPSGTGATLSFFAKAAGRNWVGVLSNNGNISFFNISNGTLGTIAAGSTATITPYGNGWYRCTLYNTHGSFGMSIYLATANGTDTYTGDGTSGAFIWGCQLEASAAYATSYIPTLGAAVTRGADACSKTGISSLIGQTEGTIFWELDIKIPTATGLEAIVNIDNGSFGNTMYIYHSPAASIVAETYVSGAAQASFTKSSITAGVYKCALAYANNNTAFFVNGVQVGSTDTSCSVPATSRIQMGQTGLSFDTSLTNQLLLFKTRLTNAQLAELTTL